MLRSQVGPLHHVLLALLFASGTTAPSVLLVGGAEAARKAGGAPPAPTATAVSGASLVGRLRRETYDAALKAVGEYTSTLYVEDTGGTTRLVLSLARQNPDELFGAESGAALETIRRMRSASAGLAAVLPLAPEHPALDEALGRIAADTDAAADELEVALRDRSSARAVAAADRMRSATVILQQVVLFLASGGDIPLVPSSAPAPPPP